MGPVVVDAPGVATVAPLIGLPFSSVTVPVTLPGTRAPAESILIIFATDGTPAPFLMTSW